MNIFTKVGNLAKSGINKINSGAYTGGKVLKNFAKTQNDAFQSSIKNLNKDEKLKTKITTVLKSWFEAIKNFKFNEAAKEAKEAFKTNGPTKLQQTLNKGIKATAAFFGGILSAIGITKAKESAEKADDAVDYVSCSCCE